MSKLKDAVKLADGLMRKLRADDYGEELLAIRTLILNADKLQLAKEALEKIYISKYEVGEARDIAKQVLDQLEVK